MTGMPKAVSEKKGKWVFELMSFKFFFWLSRWVWLRWGGGVVLVSDKEGRELVA